MTLRCPACGKINELAGTLACQRCSCDLTTLTSILRSAQEHLTSAGAQFRSQQWEAALWHASESWNLRHTPVAARLACLAAAALGDSGQVWQWLPLARQSENDPISLRGAS